MDEVLPVASGVDHLLSRLVHLRQGGPRANNRDLRLVGFQDDAVDLRLLLGEGSIEGDGASEIGGHGPVDGADVDEEERAGMIAWVEAMNVSMIEYSIEIQDIDARGDLAFVPGTFNEAFTVEGVPDPMADNGKFIQIWRQQADGSWQVTVDICNSNLPLPESEG